MFTQVMGGQQVHGKQGCWCGRKTFHRRAVGRGSSWANRLFPVAHRALRPAETAAKARPRFWSSGHSGQGPQAQPEQSPAQGEMAPEPHRAWRSRRGLCGEMLVQERLNIGFFNPTADQTRQRACQSRPPGPWQTRQTTCCARRPRNLFLKSCPEESDVAWLLSPDVE